jgi:hypothetical protein
MPLRVQLLLYLQANEAGTALKKMHLTVILASRRFCATAGRQVNLRKRSSGVPRLRNVN